MKDVLFFFNKLDQYYEKEIIFLEFQNCFQTLISVILSAQTTDKQVNRIMGPLFRQFPDAQALSGARVKDVEQIIRSVGFYKVKSRNIISAAKMLVDQFHGEVPNTMEDLLKLSGVGRKSANVVLGHCFDFPAIIVDTHFGRVVRRFGLTESENPNIVERDIATLLDPKYHYRFSMTANNHGRIFCHSRKPNCLQCFLNKDCPSAGVIK